MYEENADVRAPDGVKSLVRWVRAVIHPVEPLGDYFTRLQASVAASAPPARCTSCG